MSNPLTDQSYLTYQYATADKLRIRAETHARYSERQEHFLGWIVDRLAPRAGALIVDVGCGPGSYHPLLARAGAAVTGVDASEGMLAEAAAQARRESFQVTLICADAQRLPLRDACADGAMANHMLYHVPDIPAALAELRRIVRPGATVVMATNGGSAFRELYDLHAAAARALGYTPSAAFLDGPFTLESLALVRSIFPEVQVFRQPNAFVFPAVEPALRYYASGIIDAIAEAPADGSHRAPLLAQIETAIRAILAREGIFRVSKEAGCFVARVGPQR